MDQVTIGNAQAFWGDQPSAPATLIRQYPQLDYLTLDYLSEVSLSIMAIQRDRDPKLGYAADFVDVVRSLVPAWQSGCKTVVICNAGGLNPQGCAEACMEVLREAGIQNKRIATVSGDDVLHAIRKNPGDAHFCHLETGASAETIVDKLVIANAYVGADPIVEALSQNAEIVITGRAADPSLTVAPCIHRFGWNRQAYEQIAGATVAGHLIECGTQVTGGISNQWLKLPDLAHIGFPIAEVNAQGHCVITKPDKTGGRVSIETVKEQLVYEIGDPARYLSPDVAVSFLDLAVSQVAPNRISVKRAIGSAPTDFYKVSVCYRAGYKAGAMLTIVGYDAVQKGRKCGEIIIQRVADAGFQLEQTLIECLGSQNTSTATEIVMRVAVNDSRREAVEAFAKEIAPMVTSGPAGTTGYITGRPKVRPVFGFWPCLIPRSMVHPTVRILEAS